MNLRLDNDRFASQLQNTAGLREGRNVALRRLKVWELLVIIAVIAAIIHFVVPPVAKVRPAKKSQMNAPAKETTPI